MCDVCNILIPMTDRLRKRIIALEDTIKVMRISNNIMRYKLKKEKDDEEEREGLHQTPKRKEVFISVAGLSEKRRRQGDHSISD